MERRNQKDLKLRAWEWREGLICACTRVSLIKEVACGGERFPVSKQGCRKGLPWRVLPCGELSEAPCQLPGSSGGGGHGDAGGCQWVSLPLTQIPSAGWLSGTQGFDVNPCSLVILHSSPASHHELNYREEMEPQIRAARMSNGSIAIWHFVHDNPSPVPGFCSATFYLLGQPFTAPESSLPLAFPGRCFSGCQGLCLSTGNIYLGEEEKSNSISILMPEGHEE